MGLHYLAFDGNADGQDSAQNLVTFSEVSNSTIEHCRFYNIGKHALLWSGGALLYVENNKILWNYFYSYTDDKDSTDMLGLGYQWYSEIAYNYVYNNATSGVTLVARAPHFSNYHHNTLYNVGLTAMNFESAYYCEISYNTIINSGGAGLGIGNNSVAFTAYGNSYGNKINGNFVNSTGASHGMALVTFNSTIQHNTIHNCFEHGLSLTGDYNDVGYNIIFNNDQGAQTSSGIRLGLTNYTKIHHNHVYDDQETPTQDYGIRDSAAGSYTNVEFNKVSGAVTLDIKLDGSNTFAYKNK
jgi:hypothetical protein